MSKYTSEVRFICESLTGHEESSGYDGIDEIIEQAIPLIFSFDFPIFDENYREVLCTKILRHYYTREIGLETYGLWKLKLQTKLNEIMPYYNKLYESELLKFNPLYDVNMTTVNSGSKTGESTNIGNNENKRTSNRQDKLSAVQTDEDSRTNTLTGSNTEESDSLTAGNNVNRDMYSDTPQGALTGVESGNYLTNARKVTGETNASEVGKRSGTSNSTESSSGRNSSVNTKEESGSGSETNTGFTQTVDKSKNTEDYVMQVMGKTGGVSYAKLLKEFRDTFLNIDMEIIKDLGELFMLLW